MPTEGTEQAVGSGAGLKNTRSGGEERQEEGPVIHYHYHYHYYPDNVQHKKAVDDHAGAHEHHHHYYEKETVDLQYERLSGVDFLAWEKKCSTKSSRTSLPLHQCQKTLTTEVSSQ